jgi:hypothetical protein
MYKEVFLMVVVTVFKHALLITVFVFVMMMLVDFVDTVTQRRMTDVIKGGPWRQYSIASLLGSTPGCLGAFMNVSLYIHGTITFGAVVGGMIATSGDEAFVMLSEFPGTACILFGLLFLSGIVFAWLSDKLTKLLGIVTCESCRDYQCDHCVSDENNANNETSVFKSKNVLENIHSISFTRFLLLSLIVSFLVLVVLGKIGPAFWNWKRITFVVLSLSSLYIGSVCSEHYLHAHIWDHIVKRHLLRVFFWSFGALLFVHFGLDMFNLEVYMREHMTLVLLFGALIGVIPESGPHLIFVMMYAQGLVPFSVLFTASFVQDGHGMLPLLSFSIKDSILIKVMNLAFGLVVGGMLFVLGF